MNEFMKRIVDPIYGYIPIRNEEMEFIDTLIFQRLRNIHQSGTAYLTYPASNHTRFQHSLGVMHIASNIMDLFWEKNKILLLNRYRHERYFDDLKKIVRLCALLHDIGHGPFSHVCELLSGRVLKSTSPHETVIKKLLTFEGDNLMTLLENKRVVNLSPDFTDMIPNFFSEEPLKDIRGEPLYYQHFYKALIDGDIDADNMDYLLRDSYVTASPVAWMDIETLLHSIAYVRNEDELKNFFNSELGRTDIQLIFDRSGISALESFIVGRRKLYKWLNFHQVVCLTDEATYRIMRLLCEAKLLSREDFGLDPFIELIRIDIEEERKQRKALEIANKLSVNFVEKKVIYEAPKVIDDQYILEKLRYVLRKIPKELRRYDSFECRTIFEALCDYSRILQRRDNRSALWKVSLIQIKEYFDKIEKIWKKLCNIREKDMKNDSNEFDREISEIELEINKSLKEDPDLRIANPQTIIAIKPYKTVKDISPIIRTSKDPEKPKLTLLKGVPNIISAMKEGEKEDPAIYVYVRGIEKWDHEKNSKAIADVIEIFESH